MKTFSCVFACSCTDFMTLYMYLEMPFFVTWLMSKHKNKSKTSGFEHSEQMKVNFHFFQLGPDNHTWTCVQNC